MQKEIGGLSPKLLLLIAALVIAGTGVYLFTNKQSPSKPTTQVISTPTATISPETSLLADIAVWYPSAPWSQPKTTTEQTALGNLDGESIQATITSQATEIPHFETVSELTSKGFILDNNLSADGPGSSTWGYSKKADGKTQVITFSYKTQPSNSNPNEPLQFNCPCKVDWEVFVSKPF